MKIKLAKLAAVLFLSLSLVQFLSAAESAIGQRQAQNNGGEDKQGFTAPVFTKNEVDYAKTDPAYFTIDTSTIKVTLREVKEEPNMSYVNMNEISSENKDILVTIDSIINIASKIWKIIADNAPVVNIDTKYAVAYPEGITSATQLAQWSKPKSYVYGFYAQNLYGSKMIDVEYKATYTYGGNYKGVGKFLTAVTVVPTKVNVGWGYRFSMNASVPDSTITNVGTDKNPIAAMQLKLLWKMSTVLKESDGTSVYYVQGDGYFDEIASPFSRAVKIEDLNSASPLLEGKKIFE
ncbi:MAG: hypothetical protein NTX59_07385 [Elusimicrobia bacterium]|nr:hypothetical protein [Elusimicrobiota bacterium]